MSKKLSPATDLTPLPIGLREMLFPRHPLARIYVLACTLFVVVAAHDFWYQVTHRLVYGGQDAINREVTLAMLIAIIVAKLAIVAPAHELLHAWRMQRAGIPWDDIRRKLFAVGNAWVSAPNYALGYHEAIPILLTPLALAIVYLPLTLLHGPFHFGVTLVAFGAFFGPISDVAIASRMWDMHRVDPHVHIVERIDDKTKAPKLFWISLKT